jgi:Amt family ammonium transporter
LLLFLIDKVLGIRVTPDQETEGLDVTQHNERGYIL